MANGDGPDDGQQASEGDSSEGLERELGGLGSLPPELAALGGAGMPPPDQMPVRTVEPSQLQPPPEPRGGGSSDGRPSRDPHWVYVPSLTLLHNEAFWSAHAEMAQEMSEPDRATFYVGLATHEHAMGRPADRFGQPLYRHDVLYLEGLQQQIQAQVQAGLAESNRAAAERMRQAVRAALGSAKTVPEAMRMIEEVAFDAEAGR